MDERLQQLANEGADITIKLSKKAAFVQIRTKEDTFKGAGSNFDKAADRAVEAYHSKLTSVRKERRNKEREREMIFEGRDEWDDEALRF